MAQNFIQDGDRIEVVGAFTAGAPVLVGVLVGIALNTTTSGQTNEVKLHGVFTVNKASGAWSQGDKLYWDATNSVFTKTATNNTAAGFAWLPALSGDTTGQIKLQPGA
jgi:predicted RecA/RadA family phage recombinase